MKKLNHPLPYLLLTLIAVAAVIYSQRPVPAKADLISPTASLIKTALTKTPVATNGCGLTPSYTCNYTFDMTPTSIDFNQPGLTANR